MIKCFFFVFLLAITSLGFSQDKQTANTLKLTNGKRDQATIQDMAWLAGHWFGTALGGVTEELWTPPQAKSMMGSYRLIKNDSLIIFFELLTLFEEDNSLTLRLKHFNNDLTGWEEKNEVREFKLIKKEGNKVYFEGMTWTRLDDNSIRVFLAIQKKNGEIIEEVFDYKKRNTLK